MWRSGLLLRRRRRHFLWPSSSQFSNSWSSFCSDSPVVAAPKEKAAPLQERQMRDKFRVWAKGGDGGNGCYSIRRGRGSRFGKADGGNGGRGGDVLLECTASLWDFSSLQHRLTAQRGGHGTSKRQIGSRGSDKVVQVPVGTVIHHVSGDVPCFVESDESVKSVAPWDMPGSIGDIPAVSLGSEKVTNLKWKKAVKTTKPDEEGECEEEGSGAVVELTEPGQRVVIARGGAGGYGNAYHVLEDSKSREPMDDEDSPRVGMAGSECMLILELKSIADVGLVGLPNVGKSTLLASLSRAQPAISNYAFTTLRPNIGSLQYNDFFSVKVADIPGLIKGAHQNRGLGHAFLRHIERTKVLVYVVDLAPSTTANSRKNSMPPPWEQLRDLVSELEHYQEGLSERPAVVVGNKIDEEGAEAALAELLRRIQDVPVFPVCAVLGDGVPELKIGLRKVIDGIQTPKLTLCKINVD